MKLGLSLPIDNALFVQELEARDYFGAIESGPLLGKASALLDVEHEITAIQILHHEEQVALQDIEDIENIASDSLVRE